MVNIKITKSHFISIISIISIIGIGIGILFDPNYNILDDYCKIDKINKNSTYNTNNITTNNDGEYVLITNNHNHNDNEYYKMYNIIKKASGLDKDPYGRTISPRVVKKFCRIAKNKSINLDNMTEEQFDTIYKNYTEYLIEKYEKKN